MNLKYYFLQHFLPYFFKQLSIYIVVLKTESVSEIKIPLSVHQLSVNIQQYRH